MSAFWWEMGVSKQLNVRGGAFPTEQMAPREGHALPSQEQARPGQAGKGVLWVGPVRPHRSEARLWLWVFPVMRSPRRVSGQRVEMAGPSSRSGGPHL